MKLNLSLLAAVIHADHDDTSSGDIGPILDQLQSYCTETYGLPAYETGRLTKNQFARKWTNRKVSKEKLFSGKLKFKFNLYYISFVLKMF